MRLEHFRIPTVLLAVLAAVPLFAAIGPEVTLPAAGYLDLPDDLVYRTELTVTNYRDALQYVQLSLVRDGFDAHTATVPLQPHETLFLPTAGFATSSTMQSYVGALRVRAVTDVEGEPDPNGQIEANAFIIAERGLGRSGSSRQEIAGIPSLEYTAEEAVFLGVRHSLGTGFYTNVGITNLDPLETVTFYVTYQYLDPVAVTVPPLSQRAIRIPGEGNGGRWVRISPEWALPVGPGVQTLPKTPWVAYTSSVNTTTGDAFSGMRVPASSKYLH